MALLTISQASKDWHTSRSRLYQLKAKGRLSFTTFPDGSPALDTAELTRALGEPADRQNRNQPVSHDTVAQLDANYEQALKTALLEEVKTLQVQVETLQRERDMAIEDKSRLLGILENTTRQLQGPATPVDSSPSLNNSPIMRLLLTKIW